MAESKTLCSIYEVTRDEDLKVSFAPLGALLSSLNVFLLYRTTDAASLLSPQTTSIQNPILQITERRKLDQINQDTTHEINGSVIIFVFPCKTYDALRAALPKFLLLSHNKQHSTLEIYGYEQRLTAAFTN